MPKSALLANIRGRTKKPSPATPQTPKGWEWNRWPWESKEQATSKPGLAQFALDKYSKWDDPSFKTGLDVGFDTGLNVPFLPKHIDVLPREIGVKGAAEAALTFLPVGKIAKGIGIASGLVKGAKAATQAKQVLPAVAKLTKLIKEAKPLRVETEALRSVESSKRAGMVGKILEENKGEEAFVLAKSSLEGKMPSASATTAYENLRKQIRKPDIDSLFEVIRTKELRPYDKINTSTGLQKLLLGQIPQEGELKLLEEAFGSDLIKAVLGKRKLSERVWENILEIGNAPRALLSSVDVSGLLRQGGVLSARHPVEAAKAVKPMLKALFSDKGASLVEANIKARPFYQLGERYGLYMAPQVGKYGAALGAAEEAFMSKFMAKVPFIKASNRGYVAGLNELRSRVWNQTLATWQKAGLKPNVTDYTEMAKFINAATGRGQLGVLSKAAPLANAMLFSPRLIASRLQLLTLLFSPSAATRKEAAKTLVAFLGIGTTVLTAMELAGVGTVEKDPRSSDFGKLKVGNTRLDVWTGYAQYSRLLTQLATGERKTQAGTIAETTAGETGGRFFRSKLSPAVGLLWDIATEKTYMGEEMTLEGGFLAEQAYQRMMPLAVQDVIDAIQQEGPVGGIIASPSFLGVGVMTYPEMTPEEKYTAQQAYAYQNIEKKVWSQHPPEVKSLHDQINKLEKTDLREARKLLYANPAVMWARKTIAQEKIRWKQQNRIP